MILGTYNVPDWITNKLSSQVDIVKINKGMRDYPIKVDSLLINMIDKSNEELYAYQAILINEMVKSVPTIFFDEYNILSYKEYEWLKGFKTLFLEPFILARKGFQFQPFPLNIGDIYISSQPSIIDYGYKGPVGNKIKQFEKYYLGFSKSTPSYVCYNTLDNIPDIKINEYKDYNLIRENFLWNNVNSTVAIHTDSEYRRGYFNPEYFNILMKNCLVLLPEEHRFYTRIFKDYTIYDLRDMMFFTDISEDLRPIMIEEILTNVTKHFPEFTVEYFINIILKFVR